MLLEATKAAHKGDITTTCGCLAQSNINKDNKMVVFSSLAERTIDNYAERWNSRLLPFIEDQGFTGPTVADALAPCPWDEGFREVALSLAIRNIESALDYDEKMIQSGKRDHSKMTSSWVAENIAVGWRCAYLSALLILINQTDEEISWADLNKNWRNFKADPKKLLTV
jgi:hypothetical protein